MIKVITVYVVRDLSTPFGMPVLADDQIYCLANQTYYRIKLSQTNHTRNLALLLTLGEAEISITGGGAPGPEGPQGPQGPAGVDGAAGSPGDDGREVELQNSGTHIQWRYVGDIAWTNLVLLSDITGPQGIQGPQGPAGADGDDGAPGAPGADGADGADGTNGNTVLYGTAAPTTEGVNGDFYIRTTTNYIYGPKAGGVWPAGTSLIGPTRGNAVFVSTSEPASYLTDDVWFKKP